MTDKQSNLDEFLEIIRQTFEQSIPFNHVLGLKVTSLTLDSACVKIEMKDELVGNFFKKILHGGVISSVLDIAGGITALTGVLNEMQGKTTEEIFERFSKIGTIDLRIDYLRPGYGKYFLGTGTIMRTGKSVAVTRMEFTNDKGLLIAVGTGTYKVG